MTLATKFRALSSGVIALSLVACSGGGGSSSRTVPESVSLAMVTMGFMPLAAEVLKIPAGGTVQHGDVAFACAADGRDCVITVMADGTVTSTGGMVTASDSDVFTARLAAEQRARTATARTKESAIAAEADQATDAGLGGSAANGSAVDTYSLAISRDTGDLTVEVADSAMAEDDDPVFMHTMDLGGNGRMLVRDNGMGVQEVVGVYSDIETLKTRPFAEVYELNFSTDGTNDDPEITNEALEIAGDDTEVLGRVVAAAFTAGSGATLTFPHNDPDTHGTDEAWEGPGAYDGAMGRYKCNGTVTCTVTLDASGSITAMSAGWIFTPGPGATVEVRDEDYLHYGFWLKKTTDDEGAVTYNEVETFAGSSAAPFGGVASVKGRATYEGGAAGVYAIRTGYDPSTGELLSANSGHFTANASLTAIFGQTDEEDIAPNRLYTLTGTIDNFALSGGEANNWLVMLTGDINMTEGSASGTAEGGVTAQSGSFSVVFHGSAEPVDHDNDANTDAVVPHPHTAVGEFNANFRRGSVAGAFGARRQ